MFVVFVEILMWLLLAVVLMCYSDAIPAYDPDTQECLQLYVGIIDVLQSYRFSKKFEHTVKSLVQDAVSLLIHTLQSFALVTRAV